MGTVWLPTFFPRWRVRWVFLSKSPPSLERGMWHRTKEDAEGHALRLLDGVWPWGTLYDIQHERAPSQRSDAVSEASK